MTDIFDILTDFFDNVHYCQYSTPSGITTTRCYTCSHYVADHARYDMRVEEKVCKMCYPQLFKATQCSYCGENIEFANQYWVARGFHHSSCPESDDGLHHP